MKKPIAGMDFVQGEMILADKPYGWTSFAVVSQWKKWTKAKTGHAGTLDPLASGLMILCTGSWTKKLGTLLGLPKEYTGIIRLGAVTPTYDLESVPEPCGPWQHLTQADIQQAVKTLTGDIIQYPPAHSAVKQDGKPLYELARKGHVVELKPRQATVSVFETDLSELKSGFGFNAAVEPISGLWPTTWEKYWVVVPICNPCEERPLAITGSKMRLHWKKANAFSGLL